MQGIDIEIESYVPPASYLKKKENLEKTSSGATTKTKKTYKKKNEKSALDELLKQIIENKKHRDYTIKEVSDSEFIEYEETKRTEWINDDDLKFKFDNDYFLYILSYSITFVFEYEQLQKQEFYGVKKSYINNAEGTVERDSISYDKYMSSDIRISEGYFTVSEKEKIAALLGPLSRKVYKKYVPTDVILIIKKIY